MKVTYKYKTTNSQSIEEVILTEVQYFDPISKDEDYENDAIPKYNDSRNYCPDVSKSDFEWIEITISESIKSDTTIRTEYYCEGNSCMIYRKDKDGFELIIQSIMVKKELLYISRMERKNFNSLWENISFSAGVHPEGDSKEEWYNLKKNELVR